MQQAAAALKGQKEIYKRFKEGLLDQKAVDLEESSALFQQAKERVLLHLKSKGGYRQQVDPRGALTRLRQQLSEAGSSLREAKDSRTEKFRTAYNAVKSRRRAQALPEALDEAKVLGQNGLFRVSCCPQMLFKIVRVHPCANARVLNGKGQLISCIPLHAGSGAGQRWRRLQALPAWPF